MRLLRVCASMCTPHFKYNRKPIYFVQVKCLREKKFALWFSTKNLRRGAWLTLTKLRTRCRKTNGCCCRQTGPDSQTARHPCIRNDNSYGFDGEMAQKKKPRRSARQQEPETEPRSRQPACEWECASSYTVRELQATHSHNSYSSPTHPVAHSHIHNKHTVSGDFTSFIVQSLF